MIFILQGIIRAVCSSVNEQFVHLAAQEEERQRKVQQAAAHSQPPVKTKMLKRISKFSADQVSSSPVAVAAEVDKKKRKKKFLKRRGHGEQKSEGRGTTEKLSRARSTVEERADMDFVLVRLDNPGLSDTSADGAGSHVGGNEEVVEEIGKQFMAISKAPSRRTGQHSRGPKLKRLSTTEQASLSKRTRNITNQPGQDSLASSMAELLPPLAVSLPVARHDGNIVTQELENTERVQLPDIHDLLLARSKTRLPLGPDSFPNSASNSEYRLESVENSYPSLDRALTAVPLTTTQTPPPLSPPLVTSSHTTHSPPPPPPVTPPPVLQLTPESEEGEEAEDEKEASVNTQTSVDTKHKSRTSQLLENMAEGEMETM